MFYTKAWAASLPDISVKTVLTKESMGAPHFGVSFRMAELKFKTEEIQSLLNLEEAMLIFRPMVWYDKYRAFLKLTLMKIRKMSC